MIGDLHNTNFEHDPGELKVAVIKDNYSVPRLLGCKAQSCVLYDSSLAIYQKYYVELCPLVMLNYMYMPLSHYQLVDY